MSRKPLDDAPFRAYEPVDLEALRLDVSERFAQQMVGLKPYEQGIQHPLDGSNGRNRTSHVLE